MELRRYLPTDREACLHIFDSNSPHVFAPGDRARFEAFLDRPDVTCFVMEHDGATIACGGYEIGPAPGVATIRWGMVRLDSQRMGVGRFLLMYRLHEIGKADGIELVRVESPPDSVPFFESQGFKKVGVMHGRVEMIKRLTVCA